MAAMRKLIRAQINTLGDDEVEVVMSTAALARDGHILLPQGCRLDNYRSNPIVLWSHDPDKPIGNAENIVVGPSQISARIRFAPMGISHKADEVRGLMKAGVVRAVSVGFEPIETEPLDPKKPRGGQRISAWELLEFSAVSVPADAGAMVTARAQNRTGKVLSGHNAQTLRGAHDHAEACLSAISDVLSGAGEGAAGVERDWRRREADVLELSADHGALEHDLRMKDIRQRFGTPLTKSQRQRDLAELQAAGAGNVANLSQRHREAEALRASQYALFKAANPDQDRVERQLEAGRLRRDG